MAALRDAFEKQHAWGTFESWLLLKGIEENSALIHGGPSLPPEDRDALIALLKRDLAPARPRAAASHHYGFIEIKLLWDTLEPGNVAARLPRGTRLQVAYMLEFIDRYGSQRLCSGDGLAAADRVALDGALATGYTSELIADATRSLDRLARPAARGAPDRCLDRVSTGISESDSPHQDLSMTSGAPKAETIRDEVPGFRD